MCEIDWRLVLEYLKVLVPPAAAVLGAVLVSRLGLAAFRRQKAFERKVAWYEEAYRLLDRSAKAMMMATLYPDQSHGEGELRLGQANEASVKLADHLGESFMYADQDAHQAVIDLTKNVLAIQKRISDAKHISEQDSKEYVHVVQLTSLKIAAGIRRDMGEPALHP